MEKQTYLPDAADEVSEVLSFIKAQEDIRGARPEPRYFLAGAGEHEHVEIPAWVQQVLLPVLEAMKAGEAVTVAPQSKLLTTQQALPGGTSAQSDPRALRSGVRGQHG